MIGYDLGSSLAGYRSKFIDKRKNVNKHKRMPKGTPKMIDKIINAFDRKIKSIPLIDDKSKVIYLNGIKSIHTDFYNEMKYPKMSRFEAYIHYKTDHYMVYKNFDVEYSFKEFVKIGMANRYKRR